MDYKVFGVLAIMLILGNIISAQEPSGAQCEISPEARVDCGSPGITQAECNNKGCCFDSSVPEVIWCFTPKPVDATLGTEATMLSTTISLLAIVLFLGHSSLAKHSSSSSEENNDVNFEECGVAPYNRRDCGYPSISAAECDKRKCCFDSSVPEVNWCFFSKSQDKAQCSIKPKERKDCGYPGISAKECYSRGCCFDSSTSGVNFCFFPKFKGCSVSHKLRKDCGYPNISAKDCHSRGCCYDPSIPETVWCFYGYK
ncbi:putative gastrointestinal growth factor xP4 [Spea bombifrons]|uniref:putative gastrointestinal growth factor xP4 n=1 Tax=Spea bombifrons TaxID=233779 RepID=UPI00234BB096|nr:putative gastrointestinal growth factor xP4 [Spea bombifrons]